MSTARECKVPNDARPRYQAQDSEQTITEALAEYYAGMGALLDPAQLDGEAQELFQHHDVAHVVFGCDTSLGQEVLMDAWTIFGSDVGVGAYVRYLKLPEAREIVTRAGVGHTLLTFLRSLPRVISVVRRSRRMHKKWPWADHLQYLQRPLRDVREEFGIDVLA